MPLSVNGGSAAVTAYSLTVTLSFSSSQMKATLSGATPTGAVGGIQWFFLTRRRGGPQYTVRSAAKASLILSCADPLPPVAHDVIIRAVDSTGVIFDFGPVDFDPIALAVTAFPIADIPRVMRLNLAGKFLSHTVAVTNGQFGTVTTQTVALIAFPGTVSPVITKTTAYGISQNAVNALTPAGNFFTGVSGGGF